MRYKNLRDPPGRGQPPQSRFDPKPQTLAHLSMWENRGFQANPERTWRGSASLPPEHTDHQRMDQSFQIPIPSLPGNRIHCFPESVLVTQLLIVEEGLSLAPTSPQSKWQPNCTTLQLLLWACDSRCAPVAGTSDMLDSSHFHSKPLGNRSSQWDLKGKEGSVPIPVLSLFSTPRTSISSVPVS